jgi:hypothetical protein
MNIWRPGADNVVISKQATEYWMAGSFARVTARSFASFQNGSKQQTNKQNKLRGP